MATTLIKNGKVISTTGVIAQDVLIEGETIDEECRGLMDAARRLNEVNRQVRNLIAANVAARLDALTGSPALYRAGAAGRSAYAWAGQRT